MLQEDYIPYDMYLEIFSHISNNDKATLSACSQVAPCFRDLMQKRLFKSIDLDYQQRCVDDINACYDDRFIVWADEIVESKSKMLLGALESNPKLALHIEELKLTINGIASGYNDVSKLEDKTISAIDLLSYISSLTSLSVISAATASNLAYEAYSKPLQCAIRQLFARNTKLTSVNLSGIYQFAIAEVQYLPSTLKSLTLLYISNYRPVLPGENGPPLGDQEGAACTPTSLCIATSNWTITECLVALRGEVSVHIREGISDRYSVHRYTRRAPYLSLAMLESIETAAKSSVHEVRELLSFADPGKIQGVYIGTPTDITYTTHSVHFDDHEEPRYQLVYEAPSAGPYSLNATRLDLSDFSALKSFEIHGKMLFVQERSLLSTKISTYIPWLTHVIEKLPRPHNVGVNAVDNTQGPSLRSIRVVLHVNLMVISDDNKSRDVLASFDFSPLVNVMKKIQHQYRHLHDVACSLDFEVTVCQDDMPDSEYPPYSVRKEDFLETLESNLTLQDDSGDNKVMLQVLDVGRRPYNTVWDH
ncbi:hypothetical protein CVT24_001818 [Panaeolus cyanescens]|uniref:F-box domain-containing protein n=1 Tax=Panaeolus cyanescens TaxID=181874 RepID=A0A409YFK7_9AGAR|nr:hypothetical protein CVT24_001818 [Panaeolus cyanescens]